VQPNCLYRPPPFADSAGNECQSCCGISSLEPSSKGKTNGSPNAKNSLDFEERDRAIRIALELDLKNVELVIAKEDGAIVLAHRCQIIAQIDLPFFPSPDRRR
jgi:hypothetical protein